jgi:hypothetical protein
MHGSLHGLKGKLKNKHNLLEKKVRRKNNLNRQIIECLKLITVIHPVKSNGRNIRKYRKVPIVSIIRKYQFSGTNYPKCNWWKKS